MMRADRLVDKDPVASSRTYAITAAERAKEALRRVADQVTLADPNGKLWTVQVDENGQLYATEVQDAPTA